MASTSKRSNVSQARSQRGLAVARRPSKQGDEIVTVTNDGVAILRQKAKPTHFTSEEIRQSIRDVLNRTAKR